MTGTEWARTWTARVGDQLKGIRQARGVSAQQLSDKTAEIGYPVSRNTITAIETGRRETVSVQEVSVLARALGTAPFNLLFPFEQDELIDSLPQERTTADEAAAIFKGSVPPGDPPILLRHGTVSNWVRWSPDRVAQIQEFGGPAYYFAVHQQYLELLTDAIDQWTSAQGALDEAGEFGVVRDDDDLEFLGDSRSLAAWRARWESLREKVDLLELQLKVWRSRMAMAGIQPPDLRRNFGDLAGRMGREAPAPRPSATPRRRPSGDRDG